MEEQLSPKRRRELQSRMLEVFKKNISTLSKELQQILVDDLVTAFQNRMLVFTRIQTKKVDNNKHKLKKVSLNP